MSIGGVLGAIGSGLSFIPVVGQALGAVTSIAGAATDMGMAAKQKRKQEEELKKKQQEELLQSLTQKTGMAEGAQRPEAMQAPAQDNAQVKMPQKNTFQQRTQQGEQDGYQGAISSEVANIILGGDLRDFGGP